MKRLWNKASRYKTFYKYGVVGVLGTLIDVGILYLLVEVSGINPETNGLFYIFATISFVLAVINNFALNRIWTFSNRERNIKKQFAKFFIISLVGLALTQSLLFIFVSQLSIWYIAAKLLTSIIVLLWNFTANKYWTFRAQKHLVSLEQEQAGAHKIYLSVVIPAYDEETRLEGTLRDICHYLAAQPYTSEIILVDDGSRDQTARVAASTWDSLQTPPLQDIQFRYLKNPHNMGKGFSVKHGVLASAGSYVLFMDADNSTKISEFTAFTPYLKPDTVLIGSRYHKQSILPKKQPWYRLLIGRISNICIQFLLIEDIRDTQCGFKVFPYPIARDIFLRTRIARFGFDMEVLALAKTLGFHIRELPITWTDTAGSKVRAFRDTLRTFSELMRIKINFWSRAYDTICPLPPEIGSTAPEELRSNT